MKAILATAFLIGGLTAVCAQNVFVLGGPGTTPVPPIVYQPPVINDGTAVSYQPGVPAIPAYAAPVYPVASACASTSYSPNVIYVGGPGSCGPGYYGYSRYYSPNVIYFGRGQAYRQGYSFGHCR